MVSNGKLTKKWKLRGLKLRGLMWNQISTPKFAYQNDHRNKIYTLRDFENKTPTHIDETHAISKSERNFQNRIPRELDKKFYIPGFVEIHWIHSSFWHRCSSIDVPPLENLPDLSEFPSFLGKYFGDRQCGRITRSRSSRFNPIH